ncbi:MAG: hypothetical protein C5B51_30265 [Terriglobia bacterium]|nr:MAG: hypothetical protein C5B51_30265 [Terriglobia bacterium]
MTRVPALEGYSLWADTWDATPSPIVALEERVLQPWIDAANPRRAVDIGCGTGRWAARLRAIGIDASSAMLAIAARKPMLGGRLALADAGALPLATGSADLALCTLTIGHVPDQAAAMKELARILQPGGNLILTDFHPAAAERGWRRTFRHNGHTFELENYPYTLDQLCRSAPSLVLREQIDAAFAEPELPVFEKAGRADLFEEARGVPAVLVTRWSRA